MERRKFVIGLGALATGSAAATGTGALTATQASREVDVSVASGDASAYLRLDAADNNPYVTGSGESGEIAIQLDSDNATSEGGQGVNPNSVTIFKKLFQIENQATNKLKITAEVSGPHSDRVVFPYGDVENDSYSSLRGAGEEQPTISAQILKDESNGGTTEYNNGVVPEKPGPYGGSTPPRTFDIGESAWVSLVVDTRGDDVSANDNLINSVKIFAEEPDQ